MVSEDSASCRLNAREFEETVKSVVEETAGKKLRRAIKETVPTESGCAHPELRPKCEGEGTSIQEMRSLFLILSSQRGALASPLLPVLGKFARAPSHDFSLS